VGAKPQVEGGDQMTEQLVRVPASAAPEAPSPEASQRSRGRVVNFRGEDEFHQCWYPVALSAEVTAGSVIGAPFLDGRVVVYRTSDSAVHVQSAYCRHMGADLAVGQVVDDQLQCPFHLWSYDSGGACVKVPAGDKPPRNAKLFNYTVAESLGIIWAFNGDTPPHPAPHFDLGDDDLVINAFRNPLTMQVDSSVVFMNTFDLQHFRVVHGMPIDVDESGIREDNQTLTLQVKTTAPEFGEMVQERKLWGVNTVTVESESNGRRLYLLHALCPIAQAATQGFLVTATPKGSSEDDDAIAKMLEQTREYSLRLVHEDAPIFDTIRFRVDCMTASDKFLLWGVRYISKYPRAHPGRTMIN